jgi:hypothetical protein
MSPQAPGRRQRRVCRAGSDSGVGSYTFPLSHQVKKAITTQPIATA